MTSENYQKMEREQSNLPFWAKLICFFIAILWLICFSFLAIAYGIVMLAIKAKEKLSK
jgi:hypothetical protein